MARSVKGSFGAPFSYRRRGTDWEGAVPDYRLERGQVPVRLADPMTSFLPLFRTPCGLRASDSAQLCSRLFLCVGASPSSRSGRCATKSSYLLGCVHTGGLDGVNCVTEQDPTSRTFWTCCRLFLVIKLKRISRETEKHFFVQIKQCRKFAYSLPRNLS